MARWDYICDTCGTVKEWAGSWRVRPDALWCCDCADVMRLQPSAGSFVLKGPGFYQTDYVNKGRKES